MSRKFLIIGLVFVLAGVFALLWLGSQEAKWQKLRDKCRARYAAGSEDFLQDWLELPEDRHAPIPQQNDDGTTRTIEDIRQEQFERFVADFDKLGNLEPRLYPVAQVLYGENWRQKLDEYNRRHELQETFFAGSVICCCLGGALVLTSLGVNVIARLTKANRRAGSLRRTEHKKVRSNTEQSEKTTESGENEKPQKTSLAAILNCHKYGSEKADVSVSSTDEQPCSDSASGTKDVDAGSSIKHLYTDSESFKPSEHRQKTHINLAELLGSKQRTAEYQDYADKSFFSNYRSIKQAKSDIDRGAKKFSKDVKLARKMSEQPNLLNETLNRLTEEVAAIRSYAGHQEERVKKFQEGYDWNIIRSFALRVIHCIDNLERRMNIMAEQGQATDHLEEIRDELLFALESTGLERFEPQVNSDYRGQEKTAEAVKGKASADRSELKGKIADVVRCGYRFIVGEGNFKVVRAAQVRLFG
jgi:molecular chaperone GrpE (heat shock protein)